MRRITWFVWLLCICCLMTAAVSAESVSAESVSAESASEESASAERVSAESISEESASEESASEESSSEESVSEGWTYTHDPRDNPRAMQDILWNPDAVYGFSPNPESTRLGEFADSIDWTDPGQVAEAKATREAYHESLSELYQMITDMLHEAKPVEEIARAVSRRRNELRLEAIKDNPEELEKTKKSNLDTYGHEEGPLPEELYEKYGSWQTVLEKALGTNMGMDACLGLYDEYYEYYDLEDAAADEGAEKTGTGAGDAGTEDAVREDAGTGTEDAGDGPDGTDPEDAGTGTEGAVDETDDTDPDDAGIGTEGAGLEDAETDGAGDIPGWEDDSPAMASIAAYIEAVTDEASPDFIPPEDRIAVFDLDGTLMCETDPFCFEYMLFADYALNSGSGTVTDEVRAVAQEIMDAAGGEKPDGMSTRQASAGAAAYKGMSMDELAEIVGRFKDSEAWGFSGMTRGEAFYMPMVEVVNRLLDSEFTVYIVTATERNIVREIIRGTLDIPPSQVIGTEYGYMASGQGEEEDTAYTFREGDRVVFDGTYGGENAKMSKVDAIVREIGQQPVLAFGNSSGDLAMEIYTISDNPYRSAAYMVLADDEEREYGDAAAAEEKRASYEELGIDMISMRDDFKTIYGEGVVKTGTPEQELFLRKR